MRRLTARLSARRRSPLAGSWCCCSACWSTGGALRRPLPRRRPRTRASDAATRSRRAARCSWSAAPPATARTARASSTKGGAVRPAAGRCRRRRGRLPGRHRPDADGPPGRAGAAQEGRLHPGRDRARSRRTSPPWAPARRSPPKSEYDASRASTTRPSSAAVSSSAPTARPATTSPAPVARCRAASTPRRSTGVSAKHIYEAMLTGPQQMPVFSDAGAQARGEARRHRLPQEHRGDRRTTAAPAGLPRARVRGPVRLARRHRRPGRLRRLDRLALRVAPRRESRRDRRSATDATRHDARSRPDATATRSPTRGCRPHEPRPDRRRRARREARRAAGRDAVRALQRLRRSCSSSPTSPSRSATTRPSSAGYGASNVTLGADPGPGPAAASASAPSSGPAS